MLNHFKSFLNLFSRYPLGNINWSRRTACNVCNSSKDGETEARTGLGGGYNERESVEYKSRRELDSSDDEYDDFGRRKKKFRKSAEEKSDDKTSKSSSSRNSDRDSDSKGDDNSKRSQSERKESSPEREDDDEEEDDSDVDLSKYQLESDEEDSKKD